MLTSSLNKCFTYLLTRINLQTNQMETTKPNDAELLKQIVDLKKINPDLKVVIGVGEYKLFVN